MATIFKRGEYQFETKIRRKGFPTVARTFTNRKDAQEWALLTEADMRRGLYLPRREAEQTTFAQLTDRYAESGGYAENHYRGRGWRYKLAHMRAGLGAYALVAITPLVITKYRDDRLKSPDQRYSNSKKCKPVSPATVKGELDLLSKMLDVAVKEYHIPLLAGNPVRGVQKPKDAPHRERRFEGDEETRLLKACGETGTPWLLPTVKLALETAMRQGELLSLDWANVRLDQCYALLPMTKNGEARAVPLSTAAREILKTIPRNIKGRVFPIARPTLQHAFVRACHAAGITNFRFHDLRHEAISRAAEKGLRTKD